MSSFALCVTFTCLVVAGVIVLIFAFAGGHSNNHNNNPGSDFSSDSSSDFVEPTTAPTATTQTLGAGGFAADYLGAPKRVHKQHNVADSKPAVAAAGAAATGKKKQKRNE